jgi:hypothetical protein
MTMETVDSFDTFLAIYTASHSSTLKVDVVCFHETFIPIYHNTRRQMLDDSKLKYEYLGNLKSYKAVKLLTQILENCN